MNEIMGQKIKRLRRSLGMTQSELAEPEMTKSMLSHIEKGYANPSMKNLQFIAQKLNKPIAYFLQEEVSESKYKGKSCLPLDEILVELKMIDICIEKKEYQVAREKLKAVIDSFEPDKNDKVFADISYKNIYLHFNSIGL